jgi:hypothetical protein
MIILYEVLNSLKMLFLLSERSKNCCDDILCKNIGFDCVSLHREKHKDI